MGPSCPGRACSAATSSFARRPGPLTPLPAAPIGAPFTYVDPARAASVGYAPLRSIEYSREEYLVKQGSGSHHHVVRDPRSPDDQAMVDVRTRQATAARPLP